jgi:hypothetical protein
MFVRNGYAIGFAASDVTTNVFVADGKWHHFVMYHEITGGIGGALKLWVDGVLRTSTSNVNRNNTAYATMLGYDNVTTYFNGNIGTVAEGSGAPTDLEVWNMYRRDAYPSHTTAMWRFNEGAGTSAADSVGSNSLTLSNFRWSPDLPPEQGPRLAVRNLPGFQTVAAAEHITSGSNIGISGTASFTMGGWCKFGASTGTFQMLMNFGVSASAQSWYLGCNDTDFITAGLFSNNGISSVPVPRNEWIHLACSWNGTTLRIYVNAKLIYASTTGSSGAYSPNITNAAFRIGRSISGATSYKFSGNFSESFLANAALSQSVIQNIYTRGVYPSSVRIIYRFQERGGTTVADSSGNANNGTVSSESLWNTSSPIETRLAPRDFRSSLTGFTAGTLTRLDVGNAAALQLTTGTVLAWFKSTGSRSAGSAIYSTIVSKDTNYAIYEFLGQLIAYDWNTTTNRASGYYIPDNNWHLAAYVFESGVASGSWVTMDAGPILTRFLMTTTSNASNLSIGNQSSGSNQMRGNVGEVVVCSAKLTQNEIADYYYHGKIPSSAISRWRMSEGQGTLVADAIGSSTGTLSGATLPTWDVSTALTTRL